jgi:hypothetical protein
MSVSYWGKLILGCKIDDPYVTAKDRGCHHQESESKFCSDCGKPMWIEREQLSPILEPFQDADGKEGSIIFYSASCDDSRHYCGIFIAAIESGKMEAKVDMSKFRNKDVSAMFSRILKSLYKPDNFGLWMILDAG